MMKASLVAWTELYDAADEIKKLSLWDIFCEVDLAEIYLPEEEEPYYCSISGMYESPRGISVYHGHKGIISFFHYMNGLEFPDYIAESKRNCLECTWGARGDLRKKDMDTLKACERKYRGAEAWPLFRKHETGYEPWYLKDEEVHLLGRIMRELAKAAKQLTGANSSVSISTISEGYRMGRRFDFESAQYVNEYLPPMEKIEAVTEGCMITDEVLLRRLKKKPESGIALEFDMPYLPMSVKGSGVDPRPFYPRMCLLCDTENEALSEHYMINRHEDARDVALGLMIHYIENKGRPSVIYVRDPELYGIIGHLCNSIDIELVFSSALPMLDCFVNNMMENLLDIDEDKDI